jgi:hypothetical protein
MASHTDWKWKAFAVSTWRAPTPPRTAFKQWKFRAGRGNLHRDHFAIARRNASHEQGQNRWLHRGDLLCPFLCPAPASAGAESGDLVGQDLTGKAANYKDFHVGEVAEWLKAAVC